MNLKRFLKKNIYPNNRGITSIKGGGDYYMIKSEIKEFLLALFNNVWIWIALLIILLVIYALSSGKRDAIPKLFDIREIIRGYYKVFPYK